MELACGTGESAYWLAERRGARVVGLDRSPRMIQRAEQKARARGLCACPVPRSRSSAGYSVRAALAEKLVKADRSSAAGRDMRAKEGGASRRRRPGKDAKQGPGGEEQVRREQEARPGRKGVPREGSTRRPTPRLRASLLPQMLQHLPTGLRALAAGCPTCLHVIVRRELLARRRAGVARPGARFARHVGERALT